MKTMREKFEGLEKIKDILDEYKSDVITFDDEKDEYKATLYVTFVPEYIEWLNGAWYAFQEQQKKIDDVEEEYAETERQLKQKIQELEVRIKEKDYIIESNKLLISKLRSH